MKYSKLPLKAQVVARAGLIEDSTAFDFDGNSRVETDEEAHLDLLANDNENDFDQDGVLVSNGGMYV